MMEGVSQYGPDGTKIRRQTGEYYTQHDPYTGLDYKVPLFEERITLSPEQQRIKEQQDAAQFNLATLASSQSDFLNDYLGKPVDLNNEATESRLMELGRKRLDPMFAEREEALRTRLTNMGLRPGSAAWDREWSNEMDARNDAYNQLLLTGRGQSVQEQLTERNQPLNEIGALLSGSQVDMPQFGPVNMPTIPTTDVAGLINENYNQKLGVWERQNAMTQNILGGLFSLGGSLLMSDRNEKTDIERVGRDPDSGLMMYAYRYKDDPKTYPKVVGPMAQDVAKVNPDGIRKIGGKLLMVGA